MSEQDSPATEAQADGNDVFDWEAETLTDLFDRIKREAFQRSLAHRDAPESSAS